MEGRYNLVRQHSGVWMALRDGDFEEEEVWAVLKDRTSSTPRALGKSNDYSTAVPISRPLPIAAKLIPRTSNSNTREKISLQEDKVVQQSAPVSIPEWSNDYQNKSKKTFKKVSGIGSDVDYVDDSGGIDHCELANCVTGDSDAEEEEEEEEEEEDDDEDFNYTLPPHEFIARRLARSQISSSVFEGIGRTLKGRDLSKVRNAVLTKTGFLESL